MKLISFVLDGKNTYGVVTDEKKVLDLGPLLGERLPIWSACWATTIFHRYKRRWPTTRLRSIMTSWNCYP